MITLSGIYIYPIKSLGGISLQSSEVLRRGLAYDRRWMLVDEQGDLLTQRTLAELSLLQVSIYEEGLQVRHKHNDAISISIPFVPQTNNVVRVRVWDDVCDAIEVSTAISAYFSNFLKKKMRLVYMPETTKRGVESKYIEGHIVSFADGYPMLGISEASLADLNGRLDQNLPMNRFRPNLVFEGATAFEEDEWKEFKIGEAHFRGVKPCARCIMTTIDQATAKKGKEPLFTLSKYRKVGNKVLFGQNIVTLNPETTINIGGEVVIIS